MQSHRMRKKPHNSNPLFLIKHPVTNIYSSQRYCFIVIVFIDSNGRRENSKSVVAVGRWFELNSGAVFYIKLAIFG